MRNTISLNHNWHFTKTAFENLTPDTGWIPVTLPHTWNAADGADGKGEYYRGECCYRTTLRPEILLDMHSPHISKEGNVLLYIYALSLSGSVYARLQTDSVFREIESHAGGYSAFTADITDLFFAACQSRTPLELLITADNSNQPDVYPQMADFTFYGGLYRGIDLIILPKVHFDFGPYASCGLSILAKPQNNYTSALLTIDSAVRNPSMDYTIRYEIIDAEGKTVAESVRFSTDPHTQLYLCSPHLWQGVDDPYLYRVSASLIYRNELVDQVSSVFGIRDFYVDPEKGFFLNGQNKMLRGVSRHQDWLYEGYGLTREQHLRDAELIREIGANTVRLAHYQHSPEFYDACDRYGFIVWAEIPYISCQSDDPGAHVNAMEQMKELILQNYNHPSICFWGLSNEITIGGEKPKLVENHRELNDLVKELDPDRLTTMAHVSMLPMDSPLHGITDVESYNHYFGWYGGDYNENEKWLDTFHEKYPDICLGLSEYGAEGIITYQPDLPQCRDYSEGYQAEYHEHMARILMERPYLWSSHVWNMFDFGCAARDEGGVAGRNNKGLVSMDRQIKKEAFYVYKAYWSPEPFVYLCGRRYGQRTQDRTTIKVYSNLSQVSLFINGVLYQTLTGSRIFQFEEVPLSPGFTTLTAKAYGCSHVTVEDTICLERIAGEKPAIYDLPLEEGPEGVSNWFAQIETVASDAPMEFSESHYSIYDKMRDILRNEEAARIVTGALSSITGMQLKKSMLSMMQDKTLAELAGLFPQSGTAAEKVPDNALQILNAELNKIAKNKDLMGN